MPWFTRFDKPIDIPGQSPLRTLAEARGYIIELPGTEGDRAEWQSVVAMLADAAVLGEPHISIARQAMVRTMHMSGRLKKPKPVM
jgi:hypothetical protein